MTDFLLNLLLAGVLLCAALAAAGAVVSLALVLVLLVKLGIQELKKH